MDNSYVRIMKCRFCGKQTNALALDRRLKPIKSDVFDTEPCERCMELFKTHKFFIGDCGHNGFIRTTALEKIISPEALVQLKDSRIFRVEKCFACLNYVRLEECPAL